MKKILFVVFSLMFLSVSAQEIKWMTMEQALEAQVENPKKIFVDVYTSWCGPCKMLDKNTFKNPDVIKYVNENYYPVKFNAEGNETFTYKGNIYNNPGYKEGARGRNSPHLFARALGVRGYPSMVFFDEKGNTTIAPVAGYHNPEQLEIYLKLIATDDYKKITSQKLFQEYEKNFKGTFKQTSKS